MHGLAPRESGAATHLPLRAPKEGGELILDLLHHSVQRAVLAARHSQGLLVRSLQGESVRACGWVGGGKGVAVWGGRGGGPGVAVGMRDKGAQGACHRCAAGCWLPWWDPMLPPLAAPPAPPTPPRHAQQAPRAAPTRADARFFSALSTYA